jgi:hypothetical protein
VPGPASCVPRAAGVGRKSDVVEGDDTTVAVRCCLGGKHKSGLLGVETRRMRCLLRMMELPMTRH